MVDETKKKTKKKVGRPRKKKTTKKLSSTIREVKYSENEMPEHLVLHDSPIGTSGIDIYGGYINEDYLDAMQGTERADIFDKMRRSDSQVKMCLSSVLNPIKSATIDVHPGDNDDQESIKDAALIKHILFDCMKNPFEKFLTEALTIVPFGHSVFEVVHKVFKNDPEHKTFIGLDNLAWRSPRTIERWNIDKFTEDLISVTQYAYGDLSRLIDIPSEFILLFNLEQEGANYEGISLLRPCYGNWFRKNLYLKLNGAGIEKYAIPAPIATVPKGKQNSPEYTQLINVLKAYVSHQKNYITVPQGWDLDFSKTSAYDPSKVETSIDNEDRRMTFAFLANFLTLGMNTVGSYSLSNDLSDFFLGGLEQIANEITGPINKKLIPHLIKINKGPRKKYPYLKFSGISDKAGTELATMLASLAGQKIIIPDDQLEDHIRRRMKLPERSEEGQRNIGGGGLLPFSEKKTLQDAMNKFGPRNNLWRKNQ